MEIFGIQLTEPQLCTFSSCFVLEPHKTANCTRKKIVFQELLQYHVLRIWYRVLAVPEKRCNSVLKVNPRS